IFFLLTFFFIIWIPKSPYIDLPPHFNVIYLNWNNFEKIKKGDWILYINFVPRNYNNFNQSFDESADKDDFCYLFQNSSKLTANTATLDINDFNDCMLASFFCPEKLNNILYLRNGVMLNDMKMPRSDLLLAIDYYFFLKYLRFKGLLKHIFSGFFEIISAFAMK
ncbi:hypothetical protein DMUE_6204, partial [Dictyocoela muelleri]